MNRLFFGDNLDVLREHIKDESADLIYLDPPFNSNANYNVLFKEGDGIPSAAQAEAFRDTWGWGESAAIDYDDAIRRGGSLGVILQAFRSSFGDSAMMAYLAMMSARLVELKRALKDDGTLYLHCDPTVSHYLKIILDAIFGDKSFVNEISWHRTTAKADYKQGAKHFPRVRDVMLRYSKHSSSRITYNQPFEPYDQEYIASKYRYKDAGGRVYRLDNLTGPGGASKGNAHYEVMGVSRYWRYSREKMDELISAGRIIQTKPGGVPQYKRYLDEMPGVPVSDDWQNIRPINSQAQERLHYPTQKPLQLLERIIEASSNKGQTILDPFCGCGTTVEAAERLERNWLGIDVTHYAITLIERRLKKSGAVIPYEVVGRPVDLASARDLARRDKYQFQWWAAWLLGAQTYETKRGADRGIDGNIYFANGPFGYGRIIVSVKGGENISPSMVRELSGVVQREPDASMGVLVTLAEPTRAMLADAAGAGFVEKSAHGRLPRIQIATISDLLARKFPRLPPALHPVSSDQRRGRRDRDQLELLLPFATAPAPSKAGTVVDPRFIDLEEAG